MPEEDCSIALIKTLVFNDIMQKILVEIKQLHLTHLHI